MTLGQTFDCPTCHHETHTLVDGRCWECRFPRRGMLEMQRKVAAEFAAMYDELGMTR